MGPQEQSVDQQLAEQFKGLPPVVQNAITSADVQKHLRDLANTHKLHLDQWQLLENEVMLTLLGIQPIENLEQNIKNEVGVPAEDAKALAEDISTIVFEPIREELERALNNPDAKAAAESDVEAARTQALAAERAAAVAPATPPPPPPEQKAERAQISQAYASGESSTARKNIHDDPYRETPQ